MAMSLCSIYRNPLVNFKNAALGKRTVDNVHFCAKEFLQAVFHAVQGQQRNPVAVNSISRSTSLSGRPCLLAREPNSLAFLMGYSGAANSPDLWKIRREIANYEMNSLTLV